MGEGGGVMGRVTAGLIIIMTMMIVMKMVKIIE